MAGEILDQQVRIEYQSSTTDATYGQQPGPWVTLDTVWAKVQEHLPMRAQERGSEIRVAVRQIKVRMRWRSDVDSSMRLVLLDRSSRLLRIVAGPVEAERRRYLDSLCEEFTTEGDAA